MSKLSYNAPLLGNVAENANEIMKTKFNISRVFSAEKLTAIVRNNCYK